MKQLFIISLIAISCLTAFAQEKIEYYPLNTSINQCIEGQVKVVTNLNNKTKAFFLIFDNRCSTYVTMGEANEKEIDSLLDAADKFKSIIIAPATTSTTLVYTTSDGTSLQANANGKKLEWKLEIDFPNGDKVGYQLSNSYSSFISLLNEAKAKIAALK